MGAGRKISVKIIYLQDVCLNLLSRMCTAGVCPTGVVEMKFTGRNNSKIQILDVILFDRRGSYIFITELEIKYVLLYMQDCINSSRDECFL